ncbi:hypothetical protein D018_1314B, partial [Vibrio parahaemolyticus VP2007-007]
NRRLRPSSAYLL